MQRDSKQGPGSEKKWYSISEGSPQGEWDKIAGKMMLTFAESGHPVFRATSPLSRGVLKSKGGGKLSIHFCADEGAIETVFCTILSVNQLSLYGAVAEMCGEYESCHDRTGGPVVRGQSSPSFVPSVIKTNMPLNDDLAHKAPNPNPGHADRTGTPVVPGARKTSRSQEIEIRSFMKKLSNMIER